ncbi:MAG TPA: class I SAM-dependent methyltransferase [Solirubrobacterales bacterium]|jgi:ubiquinone/menaquinone biosynthesis C-methylase UbiE|nr:class I SAM-dependent methyltransferase [Solirubrobacterales bacterium]
MSDTPDLGAVTQIQQQVWSEGDFAMVAALVNMVSEELAEALEILPDERVLDVACGSGNGALAAARRAWGNSVGCDFVPALLQRGRERAAAERLEVEFVEADAQELPFEDASFDVAMSIFGAMFAPDQERTAAELLRVVKPGGRIGMANWTPDGEVAKLFMTVAKYAPPPPGVQPPVLWGTEERVRELFGDGIAELRVEVRPSRQAFRSADHYIEFFRTYFGPMKTAFERAGAENQAAFEADLRNFLNEANSDGERALVMQPTYLQVIATRA